jgi:hypothetical protein
MIISQKLWPLDHESGQLFTWGFKYSGLRRCGVRLVSKRGSAFIFKDWGDQNLQHYRLALTSQFQQHRRKKLKFRKENIVA